MMQMRRVDTAALERAAMASPDPPEPSAKDVLMPVDPNASVRISAFNWGAALCPGPGPRPPPALGARRSRYCLCRAQTRRDGGASRRLLSGTALRSGAELP